MEEVSEATCKANHSALDREVKDLKGQIKDLWNKIDDIRKRPPAWCAWAMTALGAIASSAVTLLVRGMVL